MFGTCHNGIRPQTMMKTLLFLESLNNNNNNDFVLSTGLLKKRLNCRKYYCSSLHLGSDELAVKCVRLKEWERESVCEREKEGGRKRKRERVCRKQEKRRCVCEGESSAEPRPKLKQKKIFVFWKKKHFQRKIPLLQFFYAFFIRGIFYLFLCKNKNIKCLF